MKKLNPQIFLRAIEELENGCRACCYAISRRDLTRTHENYFHETFCPQRGIDFAGAGECNSFWMEMGMDGDEEAIKNRRILALCMAATLAADGWSLSGGTDREAK